MRLALAASAALIANAVTVSRTNVTVATRACQAPYDTFAFCNTSLSINERVADLISRLELSDIPPQLTARHQTKGQDGPASNISRLGIPEYDWGLNTAHGVQSSCVQDYDGQIYCPTQFPNPISYGAIWNSSEVRDMAAVIATEARALWLAGATEENGGPPPHIGLDAWSPVINVVADPRWGRNCEVFGEDMLLVSDGGVQFTKGLQEGEDSRYLKLATTLKHWVAYQLEDSDNHTRYNFNANVSRFTLVDSYFRPFQAAVMDANAAGVMCSYNAIYEDGVAVPTCASKFLATVLRDVYGMDGYVTSDSGAIENFGSHNYTNSSEAAACAAIRDGQTDVCSGVVYQQNLLDGVAEGLCSMSDVNRALNHTLRLRMRLGLFDPMEDQPYWNVPLSAVNTSDSRGKSLFAAKGAMVLLKNDNEVLPLAQGKKVVVVGPHANALYALLGNYIGQICPSPTGVPETLTCVTSLGAAITQANTGGQTQVITACPTVECNTTAGFAQALQAATMADIVILALGIDGTVENEMHDRVNLTLPGFQNDLAAQVAALGKPTAMVIINAGPLDISPQRDNANISAILAAGYPGVYGGIAIAQTLYGKNERCCGKLSMTYYHNNYTDAIPMDEENLDVGVGRGYRYFNNSVVFPFGFGLSFTSFSIAAVSVPAPAASVFNTEVNPSTSLTYTFSVTNTGNVIGDTVLQMFFAPTSLPQQPQSRLIKQLAAYQRVHLGPGQQTQVTFAINSATVTLVDKTTGDLVSTPGQFNLLVTDGVATPLSYPLAVTGPQVIVTPFPST